MLQGETQDCEVSLSLPCPKTCKNLWRSCVDHHSFFSSNRNTRSPKYNNSTIQSYRKLITQHLGLSNSKTERWGFLFVLHICILLPEMQTVSFPSSTTVVLCASAWLEGWCGTRSCRGHFPQSISRPRVCPQDRPRPPPTGKTPSINPKISLASYAIWINPLLLFLKLKCVLSLTGEVLGSATVSANLAHPRWSWTRTWKTCRRARTSSTHIGHLWAAARTLKETRRLIG